MDIYRYTARRGMVWGCDVGEGGVVVRIVGVWSLLTKTFQWLCVKNTAIRCRRVRNNGGNDVKLAAIFQSDVTAYEIFAGELKRAVVRKGTSAQAKPMIQVLFRVQFLRKLERDRMFKAVRSEGLKINSYQPPHFWSQNNTQSFLTV